MKTIWSVVITVVFGNVAQLAFAFEPLPVCSIESKCKQYQKPDYSKRFFIVNETKLSIDLPTIRQLVLECLTESGPLDAGALPRYSPRLEVDQLFLRGCELGPASVASVLRALNVSLELVLLVIERVREPLRAAHFRGVRVRNLTIETFPDFSTRLDDDFFASFNDSALRNLWTSGVAYESPPRGLEMWTSTNALLERLPEGALSALTDLHLVEPRLRDVSALADARLLLRLSVKAPVRGPLPRLPALVRLWVSHWLELEEVPLECAALESLSVQEAPLRPAADWLARCARLRSLVLRYMPLLELPAELLRHNLELRKLTIRSAKLTSDRLPVDLLATNSELTKLDLSYNSLTSIPSALFFKRVEKLSELDLSANLLVTPAERFPAVRALSSLTLDHNPLRDSCPERGTDDVKTAQNSWLQELTSLKKLNMRNTSTVRLCPDWLRLMPRLELLDLSDNLLTELEFDDLHPVRSQSSYIVLQGNNISSVIYSEDDYERAGNIYENRLQTEIKLDRSSKLRCNCSMYWFAAALKRYPTHVRVNALVCEGVSKLRNVALDEFTCDVKCAAGCRCNFVPARAALEAECWELPRNDSELSDYHSITNMSLAGLGLESFPAAASLPAELRWLDLRNNSLGPAAGLRDLLRRGLQLRLAGNPLDCRCGAREFVDTLREYKDQVVDWERLQCADGTPPHAARCGLSDAQSALLGLAGAVAGAAVLVLAALAHPKPRAKLKIVLHVLGVRVPGAGRDAGAGGGGWKFDAFVSFAETDAKWVAHQLVPALESGRRPRRLCLHYRDWAVGELIPKQIARSVADSRRTVLVVSQAFALSEWARAEFDAAMSAAAADGRPAPLAVLRQQPTAAALQAAPALAAYLRAATYLRDDDPAFRRKVRAAVPSCAVPAASAVPAVPAVPAASAVPAVPAVPAAPAVPAVPAVPAAPAVPAVPAAPAAAV